MREYSIRHSIIGNIFVVIENEKLMNIHIGDIDFYENEIKDQIIFNPDNPLLTNIHRQLVEYFEGKRKHFSVSTEQLGTPFQQAVWKELCRIPYGETRSYQDIAEAIGNPKAVRAIGQANKRNQLPIIVPCHRVIGKDRSLTGYAGKRIDIKETLLELEGVAF